VLLADIFRVVGITDAFFILSARPFNSEQTESEGLGVVGVEPVVVAIVVSARGLEHVLWLFAEQRNCVNLV